MFTMTDFLPFDKLEIDLTLADLHQGERYICRACPVALAVHRALVAAGVTPFDLVVRNADMQVIRAPWQWVQIDLPPQLEEFIRVFDGGSRTEAAAFLGHYTLDLSQARPVDLTEGDK